MPEPPFQTPFTLTEAHFSPDQNYIGASNEDLIWLWTPDGTNLVWKDMDVPVPPEQLLTWNDLLNAHYFPRFLSGEPCYIQHNTLLPIQPETPWPCLTFPPA